MLVLLNKTVSKSLRMKLLSGFIAALLMILNLSCAQSKQAQSRTLPNIAIDCNESDWDPYAGTFHVNITYHGTSSPIDTSTLNVIVNNNNVTSALTITADSAAGVITGLSNTCDGVNVFVTIKDKAGTLASASCNVPALAINYPANNSVIDDPLPAVAVVYATYTTNTGFSVSMDGTDITGICTTGNTSATCQIPFGQYITPPGMHSISTHRCFAGGGPCCDKSSAFTFSPPVPSVNILNPSSGYISSTTADISVLFSDTTNKLGLDPNTYNILVNGSNVTGSFTTTVYSTLSGYGYPSTPTSFTARGSVPLGVVINNTIQASVTNLFYGITGTASKDFTVDSTPPLLTIAQPVSGSASGPNLPYFIYQNISLPYEADYSDSGSGVNISSFKINVNGAAGTVNATDVSATGALPVTLPVNSGSSGTGTFTINAQVSDNAGNIASANSVITLSLANIGIGSASVSAGTLFTIPVNVFIDPANIYGLGSYSIYVSFNSNIISFQSASGSSSSLASQGVAYSPQFVNMPFVTDLALGEDNIYSSTTAGGGFQSPVGLFNIANLTFYAFSSGTTDLTITVILLQDTTGSSLPQSNVQSGTVTVQ